MLARLSMRPLPPSPTRRFLLHAPHILLLVLATGSLAGARERTALTGATVVVGVGREGVESTVTLERGRIVAVDAVDAVDAVTPGDGGSVRSIDVTGLWVYPGFIDAASHVGIESRRPGNEERARMAAQEKSVAEGPRTAMQTANRKGVWPHLGLAELWTAAPEKMAGYRKAGFTTALVTPHPAILGGAGDVLQLGTDPLRDAVLASRVTQILSFEARGPDGERRLYPTSRMGAVALLRQTYLDADWHRRRLARVREHPNVLRRVEADPVLEAMQVLLDGGQTWIFLADTASEIHHALDLAIELSQPIVILGGREAYRVADRLVAGNVPVIVDLGWPEEPETGAAVADGDSKVRSATEWWKESWEKDTFEPVALGEERRREWSERVSSLRTLLESGVTVAVTGRSLEGPGQIWKKLDQARDEGLSDESLLAALTTGPAAIFGLEAQLGTIEPGKIANLTLLTAPLGDENAEVAEVWIDGKRFPFDVETAADAEMAGDDDTDDTDGGDPDSPLQDDSGTDSSDSSDEDARGDAHTWAFETRADREAPLRTGGDLLLENARVITMAGAVLESTDVDVADGRIRAIGRDLAVRDGVTTLDLGGLWLLPGIVDAHSHLAVTGINEGSQSITSEVRQADVIDHEQLDIHRALAGGVTTIHTMHGSANSMGGQNAVLKLKFGTSPAEMLVTSGPRIVKFALGENVTRSRTPVRFPNTRMGVESVMRQAFNAAEIYDEERRAYEAASQRGEIRELPRRDLRLEAVSEILAGDIWVHSHCYRADEILRLLAVAEDHGFRIATLQHVLEGYRVAPEMLAHGVGGSTFSDWWSYKIEAFQAIPHNAAMMMRQGILTSINSDSAELIRHLNLEAAKMMRFGGLEADEALRLVTINPAIQIGLGDRIGSIEVGKDADFAVFRGHPLDTHALNVATIVEGDIYFAHPTLGLDARSSEGSSRPDNTARDYVPSPPREPIELDFSGAGGRVWAIVGARLHPVSSEPVAVGTIVLRDGRIESLGADVAPPDDAVSVDGRGLHVYPGLINAASQLGLVEISGIEQTRDYADVARFQPELSTMSAVNPWNAHIPVSRAEGVLTAALLPSGGVVSGRGGLVQLDGWSMPEMLRESEIGLVVDLPSLSLSLSGELEGSDRDRAGRGEALEEHRDLVLEIEEFFARSRGYARRSRSPDPPDRDLRLEAMRPYVEGERPVLLRADSYKEILEAVRFADLYELDAVVLGGGEAWKCAELLAEKKIPVIVTSVFAVPRGRYELFDSYYANPAKLEEAGVEFAIAREDRQGNGDTKLLPLQVGMAVAHGLSHKKAIRSLTLDAARILGVDDEIGSLEPGKVADVIVTTGDPTRASTRTVAAFIGGVPVELTSLHEENHRRWSARPDPGLEPTGELAGPPPMRVPMRVTVP